MVNPLPVLADLIQSESPAPIGFYGSLERLGHSPHNLILVYLLEIGVWGLAAFIWLNGAAIMGILGQRARRKARGVKSATSDLFFCGMIAILLHLMVEDAQYAQVHAMFYWAFMALVTHHSICRPRGVGATASMPKPGGFSAGKKAAWQPST